jgi:hypothetical protein
MSVYHDTERTYWMALESREPLLALREVVGQELAENGDDRRRVLNDLEALRLVSRRAGLNEDAILDVMDFVTGWCSPHEAI